MTVVRPIPEIGILQETILPLEVIRFVIRPLKIMWKGKM
jgi:hypothetical protein